MLIDFKVRNYRSYRDEAEFSFEALDNDFLNDNFAVVEIERIGEGVRTNLAAYLEKEIVK